MHHRPQPVDGAALDTAQKDFGIRGPAMQQVGAAFFDLARFGSANSGNSDTPSGCAEEKHFDEPIDDDRRLPQEERSINIRREKDKSSTSSAIVITLAARRIFSKSGTDTNRHLVVVEVEYVTDEKAEDDKVRQDREQQRQPFSETLRPGSSTKLATTASAVTPTSSDRDPPIAIRKGIEYSIVCRATYRHYSFSRHARPGVDLLSEHTQYYKRLTSATIPSIAFAEPRIIQELVDPKSIHKERLSSPANRQTNAISMGRTYEANQGDFKSPAHDALIVARGCMSCDRLSEFLQDRFARAIH